MGQVNRSKKRSARTKSKSPRTARPRAASNAETRSLLRTVPAHEEIARVAPRYGLRPRALMAFITLSVFSEELNEALAEHFGRYGLSKGRFVVLTMLYRQESFRSTPLRIAEHASVTPATVTGLLEGLEREGYVARSRSDVDRRQVTVSLTPKGRALIESILPDHLARVGRVTASKTDAALARLTRDLESLRTKLAAFRNP